MKKITLLFVALLGAVSMNAQSTTYFQDDFNDLDISDWTLYDEDGDGTNWYVVQIQDQNGNPVATPLLRSASWNQVPLTPDNYAVTPAIDLTAETGSNTITLSWDVAAADADFADENYTVYVANGNQVADFLASSTSYNELVSDNGPGGLNNFYTKTLDITSFAGQTIYVAFRHHNVSDEFTIEIDNVSVVAENLGIRESQIAGFKHFYNASTNDLTLSADQAFSQVGLYNILGQQVISKQLSSTEETVNLSSLNTGVYLVNVEVNGQLATFKIVKR